MSRLALRNEASANDRLSGAGGGGLICERARRERYSRVARRDYIYIYAFNNSMKRFIPK